VFDYNSTNSDVLGWLIARLSGMSYEKFIQQNIWAKLGAEHDAYMNVDRACMGIGTGGFNCTLRDAARFGIMVKNRGEYNGQQVIPDSWIDEITNLSDKDKQKMAANTKYAENGWMAYKNMWWVLDDENPEFAAVGVHGQVVYVNIKADVVITLFGSRPEASSAGYKPFISKILACRKIAEELK
jgi:CubicO group peptidase (beta-lactamase class C family)